MGMYEDIADIAEENWSERMSFAELADELGFEGRSRAFRAGQQVKRAWDYFDRRGETGKCAAISRVFWSQNNI